MSLSKISAAGTTESEPMTSAYKVQSKTGIYELFPELNQKQAARMQPTTLDHQAQRQKAPATQRRGTILVVDDECGVREMTQRVLENDGFRVIAAANAQQALTLFAKHTSSQFTTVNSDRIDAAVIDLSMPDMHGLDLAAKLRNQSPGLPILAISGYDPLDFEHHECRSSVNVFLQKPFRLAEFRTQISRLLEPATVGPAPLV